MRTFNAHRRYSITHRGVQRLRELVASLEQYDDEQLRDRLDMSLRKAEDEGRAISTLDAMLGEPQTLIPVEDFDETLYAIIKEDTVVTVLPKSHGEEILQRGLALEQRVKTGEVQVPDREERWEMRRRWRRDPAAPGPAVVVERSSGARVAVREPVQASNDAGLLSAAEASKPTLVRMRPKDSVGGALFDALERAEKQAAIAAIRSELRRRGPKAELLPLWNELAASDFPSKLTIGDLVLAFQPESAIS